MGKKQEVEIKVSGRIPKYFFGTLAEEYQKEIEEILDYCHDDIETEQDFLEKFLELTLDGSHSAFESFFDEVIPEEEFAKFAAFKEAFDIIKDESAGHYRLMEIMFDTDWTFGEVVFFESDAQIEITADGETLYEGTLEDFDDEGSGGNMEEDSESEDAGEIRLLSAKNPSFGMDPEYCDWNRNSRGCLFTRINIDPEGLTKMSKSDYGVTIYMDDIIEYFFYLGEVEDFDMSKLTFASHAWADQFRNSACPTKFSYVFYDNEAIDRDQNWIRDKGVTLYYNSDDSLDFLLNG